jgi:arylsulfatase A-like enzyme
MTGRYPFNVGFYGDGDAQHISNFSTTAELLKKEGYATHAIGKW